MLPSCCKTAAAASCLPQKISAQLFSSQGHVTYKDFQWFWPDNLQVLSLGFTVALSLDQTCPLNMVHQFQVPPEITGGDIIVSYFWVERLNTMKKSVRCSRSMEGLFWAQKSVLFFFALPTMWSHVPGLRGRCSDITSPSITRHHLKYTGWETLYWYTCCNRGNVNAVVVMAEWSCWNGCYASLCIHIHSYLLPVIYLKSPFWPWLTVWLQGIQPLLLGWRPV